MATIQQFVAAVGGYALAHAVGRRGMLRDWRLHIRAFAPVAVPMVVALVSYRWSLMTVSVSFVHTLKTLGPLFTIVFSRALLRERLPLWQYVAVLPVVVGVAITTVSEAEFIWSGFLAALLSTVSQALQTVVSKRVLRGEEVTKSELFAVAAVYAFLLLLPLFLLLEAWRIPPLAPHERASTAYWLGLNGLASFVNQYSGLSVLDAMSTPLSHAIANVMKRAAVISVALLYDARPVSPLHAFGVALSILGTLLYQQLLSAKRERSAARPLLCRALATSLALARPLTPPSPSTAAAASRRFSPRRANDAPAAPPPRSRVARIRARAPHRGRGGRGRR